MIEPFDVASRDLKTLANRIVDLLVRDNDISSLAEGGDDTGNGGECLGVDDATFGTKISGDVGFRLHMDILGAVKLRRATGTDTVGAQDLDGLFLDLLVAVEVVEVVRGEIGSSTAVGKFRFRTSRTKNTESERHARVTGLVHILPNKNWESLALCDLEGSLLRDERFGCPFIDEFFDFL